MTQLGKGNKITVAEFKDSISKVIFQKDESGTSETSRKSREKEPGPATLQMRAAHTTQVGDCLSVISEEW